jgi:hypothetical protein
MTYDLRRYASYLPSQTFISSCMSRHPLFLHLHLITTSSNSLCHSKLSSLNSSN